MPQFIEARELHRFAARRCVARVLACWIISSGPTLASAAEQTDTPRAAATAAESAARLDAVLVTGTRIRRIDAEGPLPITSIERDSLLERGEVSLSDALRELSQNSFGSFGEMPNSDVPNASLPNLRGLGSRYTLTLLDGHRLPGFARADGGAAASLTGIPLAAIDRVEVLRDGASAIYGSDAIGGVINLITRRGDTEPQLELHLEQPQQDGGETRRASFVFGRSHDRGHWLLAAEIQDRAVLLGADRDYLIALAGLSPSGNPGAFRRINPANGNFVGTFQADARCPAALDSDPVFPSSGPLMLGPNRLCGYRFRDLNAERAAFRGHSVYAYGQQQLTPALSSFVRVMAIRGDSQTQLAPSPVNGLTISADNPFNPTRGELGPDRGYPLLLQYRLSALGPRVTKVDERSLHTLAGVTGRLGWGDGGDWTLSLGHNRYDHQSSGRSGYALRDAFLAAVSAGRFNPFAAAPGDVTGLEQTIYRPEAASSTRMSALELALTMDAGLWSGINASFAFGLDLRRDEYALRTDVQSRVGNVLGGGSFGAPESAARSYGAIYGEMYLPLGSLWELSLASRFDHYQDAGGALSPKLALAFRPAENWLLRGSIGRGFRAPDLVSAYGGQSSVELFLIDALRCANQPGDLDACGPRPVRIDIVPNRRLSPEHARQAVLGLVWQPGNAFQLGIDYYHSRVLDQIGTLRGDDVLALELDCSRTGRTCDRIRDGQVIRNAFGNIDAVILPRINIASVKTSGLDLEVVARQETAWGEFRADLRASKVLELELDRSPFLAIAETVGTSGAPSWRGNLRVSWQRQAHRLSAGVDYITGRDDCLQARLPSGAPNPECADRIASYAEFDAQWRWTTPWNADLALGGRNLGNRAPPHDRFGGYQYGLHDANGRVWYLSWVQTL